VCKKEKKQYKKHKKGKKNHYFQTVVDRGTRKMTTGLLSFKMLHQQPPRPRKACFKSGPLAIAFADDIFESADATNGGLALSPLIVPETSVIEMRQLLLKNFKDQYEPMSPPPMPILGLLGDGDDQAPEDRDGNDQAPEGGDGDGGDGDSNDQAPESKASDGDDGDQQGQGGDGIDDDEIEEIAVIIPAKEKKKRVRKTRPLMAATEAAESTESELLPQPKDTKGRFAAKRPIDGAEVPAAKRQKKDPDTKKYVAAGEFLLSKRYLLPGRVPKENTELEPVPFEEFVAMEEASEDIEEYLRACVKLEINGRHRDLQNIIDEGKAIDFYFKVKQANKNNAGKKPSAVELYRELSKVLDMPGSEDMNARWCQRRRAIAKISGVLNLARFGYRCSPTDLVNVAPQIERANKLKLVNFE
jgi:hypothetical protein